MVHRRVSAETSIANRPALLETTVRHAPFTVIESPIFISAVGNDVWMVITAPWSVGLRLSTVPRSSTIPVNIDSPATILSASDKEPEKSYLLARYPRNGRGDPCTQWSILASVVGEEFLGFVESWLLA
jgi:hypothetical protein